MASGPWMNSQKGGYKTKRRARIDVLVITQWDNMDGPKPCGHAWTTSYKSRFLLLLGFGAVAYYTIHGRKLEVNIIYKSPASRAFHY
jgi:hypothetical protein